METQFVTSYRLKELETGDASRNYIYGHTTPETAYSVENYPWGFRLKTTMRYWVESKNKFGQRLATQTIDPRTGKWCAKKYSTYSSVIVMFLDDNGHVSYESPHLFSSKEEIEDFKARHQDKLDNFQLSVLRNY